MITKTTPQEMYAGMRQETVPCNLCGGNDLAPAMDRDRYDMGLKTVLCRLCGFIFTNPRPTQTEMNAFYKDVYRQFYTGTTNVERDYVKESSRYIRAERLYDFIEPELKKRGLASPSILDCGCGSGTILHVFKSHLPGSRLFGVEPDVHFAKNAGEKNAALVYGQDVDSFVDNPRGAAGPFDVIVLNHVLEHLYHPVEKLLKLREFLPDNGLLLVEVPDILSPEWKDPVKIFHIAHITHFTASTLKETFRRAGFEIIRSSVKTRVLTFLCKKIARTAPAADVKKIGDRERRSLAETLARLRSRILREKLPATHFDVAPGLVKSIAKRVLRNRPWTHVARRLSYGRNERALRELIAGKRVWIVGSGPSAAELDAIPADVRVLTSNGGLQTLADKDLHARVDLLFCSKGKMERNKTIGRLFERTKAAVFLIDDLSYARQNEKLDYGKLLYADEYDNHYLKILIGAKGIESIRVADRRSTSVDLKLLQYALYFGAAEIGLIGFDFGDKAYFGETSNRRERSADIDEKFIRLVAAKHSNVRSLSRHSPLTAYAPHAAPR